MIASTQSLLLGLSILMASFAPSSVDSPSPSFTENADQFFKTYVSNGKVAYSRIHTNSTSLDVLVEMIADHNLSEQSKSEQKAFYLNAYNILVIKNVIDHYPLASPLDQAGFFDKISFQVAGKSRTLNAIENDIVRPTYNDARIHFALVCGAVGCPILGQEAFKANQLDQQLNTLTRNAINNPNFIRVDNANKSVGISQIFEWYATDFGAGSKKDNLIYINQYRQNPIPENYTIEYYSYDWKLNGN